MERISFLQWFGGEESEASAAEGTEAAAPGAGAEDISEGSAPRKTEAEEKTEHQADAVIQDPPPEGKPEADGEQRARLLQSVFSALEEQRKNEGLNRIIAAWEREAEEVKSLYPGFDLKTQLRENGDFAALLQAGVGVRRAFEAANLETILREALRYAAVTAGKKTADSVMRQAGRVQENSVLDRASSLAHRDVNSLTEPDILKILDAVSRGATIKF